MRQLLTSKCFTLLIFVFAAGCGNDQMAVYSVVGKVLHNDIPAEGAVVIFRGVDEKLKQRTAPIPRAECNAEGVFKLNSFGHGDGAPAGNYNVAISWPKKIPNAENMDPEEVERRATDRFEGKYSDPKNPQFNTTIVAGDNVLEPFVIKAD